METDDPILAVARAVHIGCALLLVSVPFFATLIWRPGPAERGRHDVFCRKATVLLGALLVVEVLSGAAWLRSVTASMTDAGEGGPSWADLDTVLTQTRFGLLWIVRAALALMLGSLLAALAVGGSLRRGAFALAMWLALPLGTALLISLAWAGHAASGVRWQAWHLFVDGVHLLAGAVWPLGLVPLAQFLMEARAPDAAMEAADRAIVARYSQCALPAVLAVVTSGVVNSWLMLPSWGALLGTTYGRLLVAKILVVVAMTGLGALNRYRFLPALAQGAAPRMLRIVLVESALALLVVLIVGVMGTTTPGS